MLAQFSAQVAADPEGMRMRFSDLMAEGEADVRGARRRLRSVLQQPAPQAKALSAGLDFLAAVDLRKELPEQTTLLIHGEGDTITPPAASIWLEQALPNAHLLSLPACGHAPLLTHGAMLADALRAFLHD